MNIFPYLLFCITKKEKQSFDKIITWTVFYTLLYSSITFYGSLKTLVIVYPSRLNSWRYVRSIKFGTTFIFTPNRSRSVNVNKKNVFNLFVCIFVITKIYLLIKNTSKYIY